ncbi:hypothetical protein QE152_g36824 [Popillia japonica]|uniref:Uncharacterized protein n=1 Tax=Popillia japonica TaxID=7064 RepID=A0AAW1ICK2_POPJA
MSATILYLNNGVDIHDPHIVSAMFLNQFTIPTIRNPKTNKAADHIHRNSASLYLLPTSIAEIIEIVEDIASKSSFGTDNIPTKIMKKTAVFIAKPLEDILNSMMLLVRITFQQKL